MENEFHVFDDFYINKFQQDFISNLNKISNLNTIYNSIDKEMTKKMAVKNMSKNLEDEKNTVNKTDNVKGNMIENVKPFDIAVAVANAKAKQEQDNAVTLYTNKLTTYINNIIKKVSLDGFKVCAVNIYDVLDRRFDKLDMERQAEVIGNVANKFRKSGYSISMSIYPEDCTTKKKTIKISW